MRCIARKERARDIRIIVDENNHAKSGLVQKIANDVGKNQEKNVIAETRRSKDSFHLQTNDFSVGAMGKKYNHGDSQYLKRTGKKICRERMILCKTKQKKRE